MDTHTDLIMTDTDSSFHLPAETLGGLRALREKILWLSTWTIHHANHVRPKGEVKVGGHQASSASAASLLTALYFRALRPQDRVAVKPHASPIFHAIQYLRGEQSQDQLERFRAFGGAQSYPSRTKDKDDVDFSTGSVGLGPAMTVFASLAQDYVRAHQGEAASPEGRMVAVVGDAEMDEGNMYEALLEGWKHGLRNCWWIIDYNRQSLDGVVTDDLFRIIDRVFRAAGWRVIVMKYGKQMRAAFKKPGGKALKRWINDCPNELYSALTFQGGAAWRAHMLADAAQDGDFRALVESYDDAGLQDLMSNLGGHCLETICEAFERADDDRPTCFLAYTIKGWGLPLAGHKDNHAGILTPDQLDAYRNSLGIAAGDEWDPAAGTNSAHLERMIEAAPFRRGAARRHTAPAIPVPDDFPSVEAEKISTQEAFGKILYGLAGGRSELARHLVTMSPDVTVSTNLGGWVNRRKRFSLDDIQDTFRAQNVPSAQKWAASADGQHLELGIAENNLFLALAALGLSHSLFGERVLPIGTLYDPFIARGLDALNYACYQDARFMVVATPSGLTLAPEGGAHQSVSTPLIGMGQPGLTAFEPAFADELAAIMRWSFEHMQAEDGGAVYLRLSTRPLAQPDRPLDVPAALKGAYWIAEPETPDAGAICAMGAVLPEAIAAQAKAAKAGPAPGLLAVTSPDRLMDGWRKEGRASHIAGLLENLAPGSHLATVLDGHPATLSWIGGVMGHRVTPLGVDTFGQCGSISDLYRAYGLDADAIAGALRQD